MEIIEGPLQVELLTDTAKAGTQPASAPVTSPASELTDDAVRAAISKAEAEGRDPSTLTISDLPQGQAPNQALAPKEQAVPEAPKLEVPEKFLKPDGEVDVEKLKASTQSLTEAIEKKETQNQKTVEDYLTEYREKERQFRNMPNPQKLAQNLQTAPPPVPDVPGPMTDEQFRQRLAQDLQRDAPGTIYDLVDIMVAKKLQPVYEAESQRKELDRDNQIRENIRKLAAKDVRILNSQIFDLIKAKIAADPDLLKLRDPHKAAWLEVKEELRLGDLPQGGQAQPSRNPSPILGGGTPPSTPSSSARSSDPRYILDNLDKLNLKDKKQEALGDAAIRALLQGR